MRKRKVSFCVSDIHYKRGICVYVLNPLCILPLGHLITTESTFVVLPRPNNARLSTEERYPR